MCRFPPKPPSYTDQESITSVNKKRKGAMVRGYAMSREQASEATTFYKRSMIAEKRKMHYQHVIAWLRWEILLCQSILAMRGIQSSKRPF